MTKQEALKIKLEQTGEGQQAIIRFHPDLKRHAGEEATIRLSLRCNPQHPNPVNKKIDLLKQSFTVTDPLHTLRYKCPRRFFTYRGSWIHLLARVTIVVGDDRFLEHFEVPLEVGNLNLSDDLSEVIHPPDEFSLFRNFFLLSGNTQSLVMVLLALMTLIVLVTGVIVFGGAALDGDGDGFAYILGVLGLIGFALAVLCWDKIRSVFIPELGVQFVVPERLSKRYRSKRKIRRNSHFAVSDWVKGIAQTNLHGVRLRVVAANIERAPYRQMIYGGDPDEGALGWIKALGSHHDSQGRLVKKQKSMISRAIVLYDKTVDHLPAGASVGGYFNEVLDLEPVFTDLYPPDLIARRASTAVFFHGLGYYMKFQLIHPSLVDLSFEVDSAYFDPVSFFSEPQSPPPPPAE